MNAFLNLLEKILTWFFVVAFAVILSYGFMRYSNQNKVATDPWVRAQKKATIGGYIDFLRECEHGCSQKLAAEKSLDDLQRPIGLMSRLSRVHLADRDGISHPVLSSDGKSIMALGGFSAGFWDAETGNRDSRADSLLKGLSGLSLSSVDIAPDGRRVAAGALGSQNGLLLSWELNSNAHIASQEVEGYDVKFVQYSTDGIWLGWLGAGPVGVWNPATGVFLRSTHAGAKSLAFRAVEGGPVEFITASEKEFMVWDPVTMDAKAKVRVDSDRPLLGLSRDGRLIAFTDGRVLEVWDTLSAKMLASLRDLNGDVVSFCREPASGNVVVGTQAGLMYLWSPEKSVVPSASIEAHEGPIENLYCSGAGFVVSTSWDSAKVWSLERFKKSVVARGGE